MMTCNNAQMIAAERVNHQSVKMYLEVQKYSIFSQFILNLTVCYGAYLLIRISYSSNPASH